ncbi:endonuclease/exonuclease/phosphatase family protein [Streptomyces sp. NPDC127039]|uniref:endonuclease/exonuclease/phosphatase family protein n=1 Tax=Streptomyces sp. NPDC127039 TaxID=3347115 RepID=UPI003657F465
MRGTGRRRLASVAAMAASLLFALLPHGTANADTPSPSTWPAPRFISYNLCGAAAGCPTKPGNNPTKKNAWRDQVVHAMDYWDADVVMFQEVCYGQYALLRDHLADRSSTPYTAVWGATLNGIGNCTQWGSDQRFGLAMFVKGDATVSGRTMTMLYNDPDVNDEQRGLLCADAEVRGRTVRACDTHLDWRGDTPEEQTHQIYRQLEPLTRKMPVVLGGDFNMTPTATPLRWLYNDNQGIGPFREVDETDKDYFGGHCAGYDNCRTGENTVDGQCEDTAAAKKIDYIFVSDKHFTSVRGDAAACSNPPLSDHRLLRGAAAWS